MKKLVLLLIFSFISFGQENGCTDATACNFNSLAIIDDGSCLYPDACDVCYGDNSSCTGCTFPTAFNYCPVCTISDNTLCISAVGGCMDESACNFNIDANVNYDTITFQNIDCIYTTEACESCSEQTDGTGTVENNDDDNDGDLY